MWSGYMPWPRSAKIDLIECTSNSNANLFGGVKSAASLPWSECGVHELGWSGILR